MTIANRKVQATSLEAYRKAIEEGLIAEHYRTIVKALKSIRKGNAWQISQCPCCFLDKHQAGRRLGEMLAMGLVSDTGETAPTDTGRSSIVYQLTELGAAAGKEAQKA